MDLQGNMLGKAADCLDLTAICAPCRRSVL